jgi:5'-nucleotidase
VKSVWKSKFGLAGLVGMALVASPVAVLSAGASAPAPTPTATSTPTATPEGPVDLTLLNINDFHGRIDSNTVQFAGTVESLRAEAGEDSTLFLSAGDNIGASLYASASQQDQPTIDVLDALELATSAVGNHEFDQGFADLTGRVADAADWTYLGANVYLAGTDTPALEEYEIFEIDGLRVAVIGAVTVETPTLVSPGGITDIRFGDPVEAVNRVAAELTEGDLADVIIAEYHEGAGAGAPDGSTLEQEVALTDTAFSSIVTDTSAAVDAIFTGHTHKQYAWDAPVPGEPGATRPVLQTGNYGEFVGRIVLTVDPDTDEVLDYTAENVARPVLEDEELTAADAALVAEYPRVAEVETIVTEALEQAAVTGNVAVGDITQDITRASSTPGTVTEDRAAESTLGNLVADALVDALADPEVGGAEIGVVNPGGIRADLTYATSPAQEGDGVATVAEANAVLPFVNNLWTLSLTGAQFKTVLEQQWQLDEEGNVPSRPFLNLGLSSNVSYTYDESRAQGDRVTSITVDGAAIDPAREYRIGSFNFLLQGGDNFREFVNGTDVRDSGLVDRDAWISYITNNSPIAPSFERRSVSVTGLPVEPLVQGAAASVTLSRLDLTSLGSPVTTEVSAAFEGSSAAAVVSPVTAGTATVAFTVPGDVEGDTTLVVAADETGTTVRIPLTVTAAADPGTPDPGTPTTPTPGTPATPTPTTTPSAPPAPPAAPGPEGEPAGSPVAAGAGSLTAALRGLISVDDTSLVPGQDVTVDVGSDRAGTYVAAFLYSTPVALGGWTLVDADGLVEVEIPSNAPAGSHRIAIQDAAGAVIGWTSVTVLDPSGLAATGVDPVPGVLVAVMLIGLGAALAVHRRRVVARG